MIHRRAAKAPSQLPQPGAVSSGMAAFPRFGDRRGSATIEFAMILPIMVLLVMGLADGVRRNLAAIDVDMVAATGAMQAVRRGFDRGRIAAAMVAQDPGVAIVGISLLECGGGKGRKRRGRRGADCGALPPGRYVRIIAGRDVSSLFGPMRTRRMTSTATVRLS